MTFSDTIGDSGHEFPAVEPRSESLRTRTSFLRSLRSKGYMFLGLVLLYMLLATAFYFSQRGQPLSQLEEFRLIQRNQTVLAESNGALFDSLASLQKLIDGRSEPRWLRNPLVQLGQKYRQLATLFPQQANRLHSLEHDLPLPVLERSASYPDKVLSHLLVARIEIDRLFQVNQASLTALTHEYRRKEDLLVFESLVLGSLGLALIGAITTLFFNRLKSDLLRLQQRAAEIVMGFRGEPLPVTRQDEVGKLTEGINFMSQALAEREQAIEIQRRETSFRDKMIALDSLAGGIAHEVGNPIACISGLAAEIGADSQNRLSSQSRAMLEQLQQYAGGLVRVSRDLAQLDCANIDASEWIDINRLLNGAVRLCHFDNRWSEISIDLDLDSRLPAWYASETQFNQIFMHILENALDVLDGIDDPRLAIRTRHDETSGIEIAFRDNGAGVAETDLEQIFEPFYSTKERDKGSGLGLAICSAIVESYDGSIRARSPAGGGLEIVIELPIVNPASYEDRL